MDELDEIAGKDKVQHLLEEAEKAMRLAQNVAPSAKRDVQRALDTIFRDIGRTVYNLYWHEDLQAGESGAELVEHTQELPTEAVPVNARPDIPIVAPVVDPNALPGFDDDYLINGESDDDELGEDDTGWYTSEVEIPDRPMFSEADGLKDELPGD